MDRKRKDMLEACRSGKVDTVKRLITDRSVDVNVNLGAIDGYTPLYVACEHGCTEVVRYLLSLPECQVNRTCGNRTPLRVVCSNWYISSTAIVELLLAREDCDPNVKDHDGNTPLMVACKKGYSGTLQLLFKLLSSPKCDPNVTNNQGQTPLHVACEKRNAIVVDTLLETGKCDPNVQTKTGDTPLLLAAQKEDIQIIQLLLADPQCDPNVANNQGETPLHLACGKGNALVVDTLLETGKCDPNVQTKTGDTPLLLATGIQDALIIQLLFSDPQCDPNVTNDRGETPLHVACEKGNVIVVKTLLETGKYGLNVQTKSGDAPLHLATRIKNTQIIKLLVTDPQCDPNVTNEKGETPLHVACGKGNVIVVKTLLETGKYGLNVQTKTGDTPLHLAAQKEEAQIIQLLLADPQSNPNVTNNQDETPLHVAWEKRNAIVVKTLLETGKCDPKVQTSTGDTPLHLATRIQDTQIIQLFLADPQCDPNVTNNQGETPLHVACEKGNAIVVKTLLKTGKYGLNVQTKNGDTPLHLAAQIEDIQIIQILLTDPQCDPNVTNNQGETPLHVSLRLNNVNIFTLILKRSFHETYANRDQVLADLVQQATGGSLLHMACECGSATLVEYLLGSEHSRPAGVNVLNARGETPLHIASRRSVDIVQVLLKTRECNINIQTKDGDTPLHLAVETGDILCTKIVTSLLTHPQCDPNVANDRGKTPLHVACEKGSTTVVRTLLEAHSCDPNLQTITGDTPLHLGTRMQVSRIIQLLLSNPRCDPHVENYSSETPLHIALRLNNDNISIHILEKGCCETYVNRDKMLAEASSLVQQTTGDSLLHMACGCGSTTIVEYLLDSEHFRPTDVNTVNRCGESPLYIACKMGNVDVMQALLKTRECNINVQTKDGDTPLHIAVETEYEIMTSLLADPQCDPNVANEKGETPLHVACAQRNAIVVKTVLATGKCDPNVRMKTGDSALHLATRNKDSKLVQLLLADPLCDPNVTNNQGETPLHVGCMERNAIVVKTLLETGKCDPNVQTDTGDTPLHLATRIEDTQIIQLHLTDPQCDPNVANNRGETPLHIAVSMEDENGSKLVECLINSTNPTNLNHRNAKGDTALHVAVAMKKPVIAKLLVFNKHCNPDIEDQEGNTPLSIACQQNQIEIATLLLSSGRVDPECVNNAGKTPAELATNYIIIQKISSLTEARCKHPIETFVKIFIIGNAETGKSTLIKAICTEASKILKWFLRASYKQVKPETVEPHTAGFIPRHFRSKHFGNAVLYDFAGQHEYYSSHAAVVETVAVPTPPAFVVVVDISEPIDVITEKLTYWWSFIENHCKRTSAPPPVILVGSHRDIIKARKENVEERMKVILQCLAGIPTTFDFAGQIAMDCRLLASTKLDNLLLLLNEACKSLRKTSDVDLRCHVLYAFLTDKFQSSIACKVSELITRIQKEDTLLPQNPAELERLLSTLSDKGQVLVLNNTSNPEDSWIILQREQLLSEVNGSIFAPDNFRQHVKDFARSTGVVPHSKIEHQFRQYPLDVVIGFLSHLEFCFKINDYPTLDIITGEWEPQSPTSPTEEFYFFPALVRVEHPTDVWKQPSTEIQKPADPSMTCQCGWFYQCSLSNQFLTSRFLHVLILRLAFKFALDKHSDQSPVILRRCSVWKHGIAWLYRDGIETVVEVGLQCRWVTVMMRCLANQLMECAQLQASIIKTILDTRADFCPAVAMVQSLIHPDCLQYRMEERIRGGIVQYSFKEVAAAVIQGKRCTIDQSGTKMIELIKLLPIEPYFGLGEEVISKLFSCEGAVREVTDTDLTELAEMANERVDLFQQVLKPVLNPSLFHECWRQNTDNPISLCKSLLKLFQDQGNTTFRDFEQYLSKYSVFSGQNPLVS